MLHAVVLAAGLSAPPALSPSYLAFTGTGFEQQSLPPARASFQTDTPASAPAPAATETSKPSLWKGLLIAEVALAAYSSLGFIDKGEILAGANAVGGGFTAGHALFHPGRDVTREAQLTLALGWIGLAVLQFDQVDREVPNSDIFLGNIIGFHALALAGLGVEWLASRIHD
jgi:hypothetical protein